MKYMKSARPRPRAERLLPALNTRILYAGGRNGWLSSATARNSKTDVGTIMRVSFSTIRRYMTRLLFPPTLIYSLAMHRLSKEWRWWDRVDDTVILGALAVPQRIQQLHEEGVRGVVNMCDEYRGPIRRYERLGIEQLYLPTTDFTPPDLPDVWAAIGFIRGHKDRGQKVYVHCKAGRGRSAIVVLCWLMSEHNISPGEAQAWLQTIRPRVHATLDRSEVVRMFAIEMGQAKDNR